jgi:trimethylamine--corrinoid protein Co-methyltransferase
LARRLGLPFRSGGALCGSKLTDSQSAHESANTLQAALHGGVNFMLHSCGWLEGGLVSSFEKFVIDADQLGALHTLSSGIDISTNGLAINALEEVGPSGHFLGCNHTQLNFQNAFWRSEVFDYKPFETWLEDGGNDTFEIAAKRVEFLLSNYIKPPIDIAKEESLKEFVKLRKNSMPDAFFLGKRLKQKRQALSFFLILQTL